MNNYYNYFDNATNTGRVFDGDLSMLPDLPTEHLSPNEIAERDAWRSKISDVNDHYETVAKPQVSSTEMLLRQRVMVPNLASIDVSSRSRLGETRKGRRYPDKIHVWPDLDNLVAGFQPLHRDLEPRKFDIFRTSREQSDEDISCSDEDQEKNYMLFVLQKSLMKGGLMGKVKTRGGIGRPDALMLKSNTDVELPGPADIGLIAEFKSTHNLPLPISAEVVCRVYNEAYRDVMVHRAGRTATWSRVCHPIGQVLGYMVENGRRYGVLSSATRVYFLTIAGNGSDAQVFISDAFLVGQPHFLRAWAFISSMASNQSEQLEKNQLTWRVTSSTQPTPPARNKYQGNLRSRDNGNRSPGIISENGADAAMESTGMSATHSASDEGLTEISIDDVEIIDALGYGRNGVVYLAKWGNREVALKQFDTGKDGDEFYDREVAAYLALKDAWGVLVPTPLFVSESWSGWIKFVGLQLGRKPKPGDDVSGFSSVLSSLESRYGFRHGDSEGGNMVFVKDEITGAERLVAIDLEAHAMTRVRDQ